MTHSETWQPYIYLHSTESTQKVLEKIYKKRFGSLASEMSYRNSCSFMYYLLHAESFYKQAGEAPLAIKPVLFFYGLTQLVKASILTEDPGYPETTSVLAHGVTTRKKKKQDYLFLKDEVRLQKNGLFHHAAQTLFKLKELDKERYTMEMLLRRIPEMGNCFNMLRNGKSLFSLQEDEESLFLPSEAAVAYHITDRRLGETIEHLTGMKAVCSPGETKLMKQENLSPFSTALLSYSLEKKEYFLPAEKEQLFIMPELLTHYLLLYNLSMISRYETEWWYDLIQSRSSNDYIYISTFMEISSRKIPELIWMFLSERM
ncbi:hypothetical protein CEF21_01685 [Bacillus sp. FJAT-42376]|uniref:YaaC family protein n=1 Tax=Bacillus sp. FJAT-42376 TaxID=2014076 RepID=UPI000F4DB400|nr:YaaC family protein [Bacillus sp. FJAT-42376]AZB41150.1 hypothetical protein CEF21_01685 [Bacillus sp. FJAT-42376]